MGWRAPILRLTIALLLLLPLAPAATAGEEPREGADVEKAFNDLYPVEFRVRVNKAIERGKDALLRAQAGDGSWRTFAHHRGYPMGTTALATLTLLKCGVPPTHPAIVRAFTWLRQRPLRRVYSVSVLLMALDAKYAAARDPFAVEQVDRYGLRKGKDPCSARISPEDLAWMKEGVAYLTQRQTAEGVWRYDEGGFDLSNTQFALLGLHAASRCGTTVKKRVWLDALRFLLDHQEKEGEAVMYKANEVRGRYRFAWTERALARGFRYTPEWQRPTGSMTTAGLASLVICQSRLWRARGFGGTLRAETRRAVRDAMAWLQQNFAVDRNPGGGGSWHYYYLYGLERAGILGRFRFLGTRDWYREGAELLLAQQRPGGAWHGGSDTCFALLFLKRATSRMRAPVFTPRGAEDGAMPEERARPRAPIDEAELEPKTRTELLIRAAKAIRALESDDLDEAFLAAKRLGELGLRRAVEPLVRTLRMHRDADVRTAAAQALGALRAVEGVEPLIAALTDKDVLVAFAAERALGRITGHRPDLRLAGAEDHGDRVRAQKAWRAWWRANEKAVRTRLAQPRGR